MVTNELNLRLLGALQITLGNNLVPSFSTNKARALLCYLAVTGRPHTRDTLANLLWDDSESDEDGKTDGKKGLRNALYELRQLQLEDHLTVSRQTVAFNREAPYWLDVEVFESYLQLELNREQRDISLIRNAVELYRGDFLEGFHVRKAEAFEEWATTQRDRMRSSVINALHDLVIHHTDRAEYSLGIGYSKRLLVLDPYREEAYRRLMWLLTVTGQRPAALEQYETCRQILQTEIGTKPEPETTDLYEQIRTSKLTSHSFPLPASSAPPHPLTGRSGGPRERVAGPVPGVVLEHFKDREPELHRLHEYLADPHKHLILITGRSGIGKTALVTRLLQGIQSDFTFRVDEVIYAVDSIIYIDLRQPEFRSPDKIVAQLSRVLETEAASELSAKWQEKTSLAAKLEFLFHHTLGTRTSLIVLDNLEGVLDHDNHISDALTDLQQFVEACLKYDHATRVLATSRRTLVLAPELEGQTLERRAELLLDTGLPESDAITMLRDLDAEDQLGIKSAPEEDVRAIVQRCAAVPRTLETIVGTLRQGRRLNWAQLVTDQVALTRLVENPARELYESLLPEGRRVMQALAIYDRPVPTTAVRHLLPGLSVDTILDTLMRDYAVKYDHGLFGLHPLDQHYAYHQIPDSVTSDSRSALHSRAAEYFRTLRKPRVEWKTITDLEQQLQEFHQLIAAGSFDDACGLLNDIDESHLSRWGHYGLIMELRLQLTGHLTDRSLQGDNWRYLGGALDDSGQVERAITCLEKAQAIAKETNNTSAMRYCLSRLGLAYWDLGEMHKAVQYHQDSLAVARQIHERQGTAIALNDLGLAYHDLGNIEEAIQYRQQALEIHREINDGRGQGTDLGNLGYAYYLLGDTSTALDYTRQALAIHRAINFLQGEAIDLVNMGELMAQAGEFEQSIQFCEGSLSIAQQIGHKTTLSYGFLDLGYANHCLGRLDDARQNYEDCLSIDMWPTKYRGAVKLGILCLEQGDVTTAENYLGRGISYCRDLLERTPELYEVWYELGLAHLSSLRPDEGLAAYRQAMHICSAKGILKRSLKDLQLLERSRASSIAIGVVEAQSILESAL